MRCTSAFASKVGEYQAAFRAMVLDVGGRTIAPRELCVSTMTLLFELSDPLPAVVPTHDTLHVQPSTRFTNQCSVKGEAGGSRFCVKMFRNGKLHVTGARSLAAGIAIVRDVCERLFPLARPVLAGFDVEMLNLAFHVGTALLLSGLQAEARAAGFVSTYSPARYPGLRVVSPWGTMLVFGSGSVLVTGCRGPEDAARCTAAMLRLVRPRHVASADRARARRRRAARTDSLVDNVYGAAVRAAA
jgi:TATA-box binding protein (TBP) (component of TFIID and TFIIIB)